MQKPHLTLNYGKTLFFTTSSNHALSPYLEHKKQRILTLRTDTYDTKRHFSNSLDFSGNSGENLINHHSLEPCRRTLEEGREMKKVCPVCGKIGILQQRGNTSRIIHYQWIGNKRTFIAHKVETPNTDMVTEKPISLVSVIPNLDSFPQEEWGCRLAWSRLGDLGSPDPGSNPGSPTTHSINMNFGFTTLTRLLPTQIRHADLLEEAKEKEEM